MDYALLNRDSRTRDFINRRLNAGDSPGIQYVMVGPDSTLFEYAGGWANVEERTPMSSSTTMMLYSMTKTIIAVAVLQLVEQGAISLDDPVTLYHTNIPYTDHITIRHLLSQTSGIPNPIPLKWVHLVEEHPTFNEDAALAKILADNTELDFLPGEKYAYSNISYWLLGKVIEKASRLPYQEYVRQHVLRKLHVPEHEADFVIPSIDHHSKGYLPKWSFLNLFKSFVIDSKFFGEYEDGWLHVKNHYLHGPSFGGMVASSRSVGIFLQDQLHEQSLLFNQQTKSLFFEQQKSNKGKLIAMTLGWHIGVEDSIKYFFKEGGGGGFHSEMRIYPSRQRASVVISNNTSFNVKDFLNTVDKQFFKMTQ